MRKIPKNSFADLEELASLGYDERLQPLVAEAIHCYRGGAYRACIVTTWVALVYDFLYKMNELAEKGQLDAKKLVSDFEKHQTNRDYKKLLEFEQGILKQARDAFEFISAGEHDELSRLLEDRHKCAHPSMNTLDEPYQPSAEQARYHLRNAIMFVFQHAPTQGRTAIDTIKTEILSNTFPERTAAAKRRLEAGPLGYGVKESVKRSVVLMVLTSVLFEALAEKELRQRLSALAAMHKIIPEQFESAIKDKINDKAVSLDDTTRTRLLRLINKCPIVWVHLNALEKDKLEATIKNMDPETDTKHLVTALHIAELRPTAKSKLLELGHEELGEIVTKRRSSECIDLAISKFEESDQFRKAAHNMTSVILPITDVLDEDHVRRILLAFVDNYEINHAHYFMGHQFKTLLKATDEFSVLLKPQWKQVYEVLYDESHRGEKEWDGLRKSLESTFEFEPPEEEEDEDV